MYNGQIYSSIAMTHMLSACFPTPEGWRYQYHFQEYPEHSRGKANTIWTKPKGPFKDNILGQVVLVSHTRQIATQQHMLY